MLVLSQRLPEDFKGYKRYLVEHIFIAHMVFHERNPQVLQSGVEIHRLQLPGCVVGLRVVIDRKMPKPLEVHEAAQ